MAYCSCTFEDPPLLLNSCGGGSPFMVTFNIILLHQCSIIDPCNRVSTVEDPAAEYDFVVVGAGVAGSVVASRLSENSDWNVLLLEAGDHEPTVAQVPSMIGKLHHTSYDWNYTTEIQDSACSSDRCYYPRGHVVGGTGVLNGMVYLRGNPKDYAAWVDAGNEGWSYEDNLPYFLKSENNGNMDIVDIDYHSVGGLLPIERFHYQPPTLSKFLKAGKELGYDIVDLNGRNGTGFGIIQAYTRNGERYSTAKAFLRPARQRRNLDVIINALATKIIVDPSTKQATGVQYLKNGEKFTVFVRKEVIVSGGAFNSPQLLLLTGIGPSEHLEKIGIDAIADLPVGNNLHDHVTYYLSGTINDTGYRTLTNNSLDEYIKTESGPLSSIGLSQLSALIPSKYSDPDYPDTQIKFEGYMADCSVTGSSDECSDGSISACGRRNIRIGATVLHTKSKGFLKLKSSNPLDPPLIDPKYLNDSRDVDTLLEGVKFILKLTETNAAKEIDLQLNLDPVGGCEDYEFGSDEYWTCAVRKGAVPDLHVAGSVKMGPTTDPDAVLNSQLQVHGINNIRVIDASVFPHVTSGNPTAAIIMIAEKGSDMIKQTWQ